jgi:HSP20 family protein
MNALMKGTNNIGNLFKDTKDTFFGRGIDDILKYDFFNSPDANMREDRNGYRLEIAVPGMRRKDITLQVEGSMMKVSAQKQQRNNSWNTVEFNSSLFQRSFALPGDADANDIKAKCRDGLLIIQIGKIKDKSGYREIKVQGENANKRLSDSMISWWHRIKNNVVGLLK